MLSGDCLLFQSFPQLTSDLLSGIQSRLCPSVVLFMMPCPCGLRGKIRNSERTVQRLKQNEVAMFTSFQQMLVVESHKRSSSYGAPALYVLTTVEPLYVTRQLCLR
jgi:hypothetical protein